MLGGFGRGIEEQQQQSSLAINGISGGINYAKQAYATKVWSDITETSQVEKKLVKLKINSKKSI